MVSIIYEHFNKFIWNFSLFLFNKHFYIRNYFYSSDNCLYCFTKIFNLIFVYLYSVLYVLDTNSLFFSFFMRFRTFAQFFILLDCYFLHSYLTSLFIYDRSFYGFFVYACIQFTYFF